MVFGGILGAVFLFVWLGVWTTGGGSILYNFLYQLFGKETIEVSERSIVLSKSIGRFGRPREYSAEHIKDLRVIPQANHTEFGNFGWTHAASTLAFDYGARTYRFGDGADEGEAKQILREIHQSFPQYL